MSNTQKFFNKVYADAIKSGCNHIQASICAAQCAIETGWGKTVKGNAYFGVKAGSSWKGKTQRFTTHEVIKGKKVKQVHTFRAYNTLQESIVDYMTMMKSKFPSSWNASSIQEAANELGNGKFGSYATDPNYEGKVYSTAKKRSVIAQKAYGNLSNVTMRRGDQGQDVTQLLFLLTEKGYYQGSLDDFFGSGTEASVRHFQKDAGLLVDGVVGPKTMKALKNWTKDPSERKAITVIYVNQHATRNRPATTNIEQKLEESLLTVFGPGTTCEIYSAGQMSRANIKRNKGVLKKGTWYVKGVAVAVGSVRHDDGKAVDIHVFDRNGNPIVGTKLAKLGQYWIAKGYGSAGCEMNGAGIHLDEWATPPSGGSLSWTYAYSNNKYYGNDIRDMLLAGRKGILPKLPKHPLPTSSPKNKTINKTTGGLGAVVVTGLFMYWENIKTDISSLLSWIGF